MNMAMVVKELAAKRFREALNGVFRRAISRLQRNGTIRQGRSNLDDAPAIARAHAFKGGHRPVHRTEVCHFRYALDLIWLRFRNG